MINNEGINILIFQLTWIKFSNDPLWFISIVKKFIQEYVKVKRYFGINNYLQYIFLEIRERESG